MSVFGISLRVGFGSKALNLIIKGKAHTALWDN